MIHRRTQLQTGWCADVDRLVRQTAEEVHASPIARQIAEAPEAAHERGPTGT